MGFALPRIAATQPLNTLPATFTYTQARNAGLRKRALYGVREVGRIETLGRAFQAKDRGAGSSINAGFAFTLMEPEPNHTTAHYDVDLTIRGRMAAFGGSIIEETAKQLSAAFASAIQQELDGAEVQTPAAAAETTGPVSAQAAPPAPPKVSPVRIVLKSIWAVIKDKVGRLFHRTRGSDLG